MITAIIVEKRIEIDIKGKKIENHMIRRVLKGTSHDRIILAVDIECNAERKDFQDTVIMHYSHIYMKKLKNIIPSTTYLIKIINLLIISNTG